MIPLKYSKRIQKTIRKYFPANKNKVFIFGSSIKCDRFRDIDVGILEPVDTKKLQTLKEELEHSTFPFFVELVGFTQVEEDFRDAVLLHQTKEWI